MMNAKSWLGAMIVAIGLSSFSVSAQVPAQPGQIALRAAVTDSNFALNQPIQLSPTGELTSSSLRPSRVRYDSGERRSATLWKVSIATMVGASAFDAFSSMGKHESNPLLRSSDGSFGAQGIAIKAGLAGISLAPQIMFRQRKDLRKIFTIANFVNTGVFAAVATHNLGIKPVQQ